MHVLMELPYWPSVSWLTLACSGETVCLEACETYQKGSYRNRCHIAGPNGIQRLSIPLQKGKHQQTSIREVRIACDEPWQQIHWRSITTAYGNAPYFEHYAGELERFYQNQFAFLFDFNLELLRFLFKKMDCSQEIQLSANFKKTGSTADVIDFRASVSPQRPTPSQWFDPAPYAQVFLERHGFLPDLSALDLLFCCGKTSRQVLLDSKPR